MNLKVADLEFEWVDQWGNRPIEKGWSHHGLAISKEGNIITSAADQRAILFLDSEGNPLKSFEADVMDAHGLSLSVENDEEFIWVTDAGKRREPHGKYGYPILKDGKVVKYNLNGDKILEIEKISIPSYQEDTYFSPTVCTSNPENGDLWITDGYGQHLIHRFNNKMEYIQTIDGKDGACEFKNPHWIYMDMRKGVPELYIADRQNNQIQVYDAEGNFLKCFGQGITHTPSVLSTSGTTLIVGELNARILFFDANDNFLGELGNGVNYTQLKGWPNRLDTAGLPIRPQDLEIGKFNSPHGLDCDQDGNIYICEWLIGGRFTKLKKR